MNLKKLVLLPLFATSLSGCGSSGGGSGNGYLKLGDTISVGDFSQKLTEFNYVYIYSDDPNQVAFELVFDLHYSGDKVTPFSPSYQAVFDGDEKLGGYSFLQSSKNPSSLAPNDTISVKFGFNCFKDWETVDIRYSYSNGNYSSFKMKSSDSSYPTNNILPTLKAGESATNGDDVATVRLNNVQKTDIGSAYASDGDNVSFTFSVTNNTAQTLGFTYFDLKIDGGFSIGLISISSNTQPTTVGPNSTVSFGLIYIIRTRDWKNCVVETIFNQRSTLRFNISHSDFHY